MSASTANGLDRAEVDDAPAVTASGHGTSEECPHAECPMRLGGGGGDGNGGMLDRPQRISLRDLGVLLAVAVAGVLQWASLTGQIAETHQQAITATTGVTQRLDGVRAAQDDLRLEVRELRTEVIRHLAQPGHAVSMDRLEAIGRRLDRMEQLGNADHRRTRP